MGHELTSLRSNVIYSKEDAPKILDSIKGELMAFTSTVGSNFGWGEKATHAETLEDFLDIFQFTRTELPNETVLITLKDVYSSMFFESLCFAVAPFVDYASIEGYSGSGFWKVIFHDNIPVIVTNYDWFFKHGHQEGIDPKSNLQLWNKETYLARYKELVRTSSELKF